MRPLCRETSDYAQKAADVARMIGDFRCQLFAECMIAEVTRFLGDVPRAVTLNEACLAFARDRLPPMDIWLPSLQLSKALNDAGESSRALAVVEVWMKLFYRTRGLKAYHFTYGPTFDALACVASGNGDATRAAPLFGAADEMLVVTGDQRVLHNDWEYAPYREKARAALGSAAFEVTLAEGRAMTPEQGVRFAMDNTRE